MVVHERSRFNGGGKYLFATGSYLSAHQQTLASSRRYITHRLNSLPTNAIQQRIPLRTDLCDRTHEPSMVLNLDTSRNSRRSLSVRTLLLVASIAAIGPLRTVTVFDCLVPSSSAITFKVRAFPLFGGDLQTTRAIPPCFNQVTQCKPGSLTYYSTQIPHCLQLIRCYALCVQPLTGVIGILEMFKLCDQVFCYKLCNALFTCCASTEAIFS